jgi:DGQHR domain-containing protein
VSRVDFEICIIKLWVILMGRKPKPIRRRALRVEQGGNQSLFLFTLTGEELLKVADISRVSRDNAGKLIGYQRPEVKRHIKNIVEYLDSKSVFFPNSLILALPSSIKFKEARGPKVGDSYAIAGTIEIPVPRSGELKPAWIVDGQQRAIALSKTRRRNLPVPVNAFIADDVDLQRDQFLRINSTKPLPRGLITELLPQISTILPANLSARKAPSALCDILNTHPDSPLRGLIRRTSTEKKDRKKAVVTDTTIVKILEESLMTPNGCLFPYRNIATGETDFEGVQAILFIYWSAVSRTFPEAWGLPPTKSRLMHSVGLRAMGRIMDRIMGAVNPYDRKSLTYAKKELRRIRPVCRWTSGVWEELGGIRWNELQNVPSHVRMLSNYLIREYLDTMRQSG